MGLVVRVGPKPYFLATPIDFAFINYIVKLSEDLGLIPIEDKEVVKLELEDTMTDEEAERFRKALLEVSKQ